MTNRQYQICSSCVLDTTGDPFISFDKNGICNYCNQYDKNIIHKRFPPDIAEKKLHETINEIKLSGKRNKYDCILGLSGGMDSSYIAYIAFKYGLKPLVVHMDNGWNAELAVKNIEKILNKTGFDYYNHVINWDEFRDLQLAYLKASVIDIEVVTDQAIFALLHIIARKHKIKYILTGDNPASESIMPKGWSYQKNDLSNFRAIQKKFGTRKIDTYPLMGIYNARYYRVVHGIKYAPLLYYVQYDYKEVRKLLESVFGWKNYEWKHCESIFTKFYQGYILPTKFKADKRRAHLSDLILSGQKSREDALSNLKENYYDKESLKTDRDFVLRKLNLSEDEFEAIMALPINMHESFPQDKNNKWHGIKLVFWLLVFGKFTTFGKLLSTTLFRSR
jgi:N-acetyl sugar amidotransferase